MNKAPAKKVTLKSLADALGLSFSTISKSLNGNPNINAETRALVEAKAREMGYAPNLFAQSLRTKSSKSIAVIFNDIENPVLTYIFKTISVTFAKHGYTTVICDSQFDAESERVGVTSALSRTPYFVIIAPASTNNANIDLLLENTSNVIVFDTPRQAAKCHFVDVDYAYGGYVAACELLSQGHRDILVLTDPQDFPFSAAYVRGIQKACAEYGLPFREERLMCAHSSMESACAIILSLWDHAQHAFSVPFTGVLCFSDNFALGVYKAVAQLGLSIPNDISVIGFDDNDICAFTTPPLTSVHLPREQMAKACIDILEEGLAGETFRRSFSLSPHLMKRHSVKTVY